MIKIISQEHLSKFSPEHLQVLDLGPTCQVFYYSKWLSFPKARHLFETLQKQIPFKQHRVMVAGTTINQPRLTCWFGDRSYTYSGLTIQPDPWSPELLELRDKLNQDLNVEFNSALANLYLSGDHHVGWHADNEQEIGPIIASISLGGLRDFGIQNRSLNKTSVLELQTGSLLVMAGETQKHCRHQIAKTSRLVEPRINLTFRMLKIG